MPKKNGRIFSLDRKLKITQNNINKTFDQLKTLKKFDQVMKYYKLIIKNFDQVKNDNFDQVKFDQVIVCPKKTEIPKPKTNSLNLLRCKPTNIWSHKKVEKSNLHLNCPFYFSNKDLLQHEVNFMSK